MMIRVQIIDSVGNNVSTPIDIAYDPGMSWDENVETAQEELDDFMRAHEQSFTGQHATNAAPAGPAQDCWNARHGRVACAKACGPNGSCVLR